MTPTQRAVLSELVEALSTLAVTLKNKDIGLRAAVLRLRLGGIDESVIAEMTKAAARG